LPSCSDQSKTPRIENPIYPSLSNDFERNLSSNGFISCSKELPSLKDLSESLLNSNSNASSFAFVPIEWIDLSGSYQDASFTLSSSSYIN